MIYSVVFPVRYSEQFFKEVVTNANNGLIKLGEPMLPYRVAASLGGRGIERKILNCHAGCLAAYHNAVMVGGICCRLEPGEEFHKVRCVAGKEGAGNNSRRSARSTS